MMEAMDAPGQISATTTTEQCNDGVGIPLVVKDIQESLLSCATNNHVTRKALNLVRRKTQISKNYSQSYYQYMQNQCNTFERKSFNFIKDSDSTNNTYVGNCLCALPSSCCNTVVYKPSNYQFANQGAVSSDLRTTALAYQTVETNKYLQMFCSKL
jgi:hypothetical protein